MDHTLNEERQYRRAKDSVENYELFLKAREQQEKMGSRSKITHNHPPSPISHKHEEEAWKSEDHNPKTTSHLYHQKRGKRHYINNYLLLETLGEGSWGKVRKGLEVTKRKAVAIKIINKRKLQRKRTFRKGQPAKTLYDNILQEIAILKKLDHPNVVKLHEVIDDAQKDKLYIVMEYLPKGPIMPGGAPTSRIEDMELLRQFMRDICMALEYLHSIGIAHMDIKPENLLIDADNRLKIADFGVSMLLEKERRSGAKIRKFQGTPAFTAPETTIEVPFHPWPLDIWAVGVTFFILGHGRLPFDADNVIELYQAIRKSEPEYDEDLDPGFLDCIRKCLVKLPIRRIDVQDLRKHRWITKNGTDPLPEAKIGTTSNIVVKEQEALGRVESFRSFEEMRATETESLTNVVPITHIKE